MDLFNTMMEDFRDKIDNPEDWPEGFVPVTFLKQTLSLMDKMKLCLDESRRLNELYEDKVERLNGLIEILEEQVKLLKNV